MALGVGFGESRVKRLGDFEWVISTLNDGFPPVVMAIRSVASFIWIAHIGFDRMLGFGLKYPTHFKDTYLNPKHLAVRLEGVASQCERANVRVNRVVGDRTPTDVDDVANY
jgi:hypothetical protein